MTGLQVAQRSVSVRRGSLRAPISRTPLGRASCFCHVGAVSKSRILPQNREGLCILALERNPIAAPRAINRSLGGSFFGWISFFGWLPVGWINFGWILVWAAMAPLWVAPFWVAPRFCEKPLLSLSKRHLRPSRRACCVGARGWCFLPRQGCSSYPRRAWTFPGGHVAMLRVHGRDRGEERGARLS